MNINNCVLIYFCFFTMMILLISRAFYLLFFSGRINQTFSIDCVDHAFEKKIFILTAPVDTVMNKTKVYVVHCLDIGKTISF